MDPEDLLNVVLRERTVGICWRQKLKWWWKNRCTKCGGKRVIGVVYDQTAKYFSVPICEWCAGTNFPEARAKCYLEKSKLFSKEVLVFASVIFFILGFFFHWWLLKRDRKERSYKTMPYSEIKPSENFYNFEKQSPKSYRRDY